MTITPKQRYQIAFETGVDPRTITRIYQGKPTRAASRDRVEAAAKKHHFPSPPKLGSASE